MHTAYPTKVMLESHSLQELERLADALTGLAGLNVRHLEALLLRDDHETPDKENPGLLAPSHAGAVGLALQYLGEKVADFVLAQRTDAQHDRARHLDLARAIHDADGLVDRARGSA